MKNTPKKSDKFLKQIVQNLLRSLFGNFAIGLAVQFPHVFTFTLMWRLNGILMTRREFLLLANLMMGKVPCRFLVFGVGHDSGFWEALNRGGRTVFIEDNPHWLQAVARRNPHLEIIPAAYRTRTGDWAKWLEAVEELHLNLPDTVAAIKWDVILVDGPAGDAPEAPGRMQSIYMASILGAIPCDIFVHDCDRPLEHAYTRKYLGNENRIGQSGRMEHFQLNRPAMHM